MAQYDKVRFHIFMDLLLLWLTCRDLIILSFSLATFLHVATEELSGGIIWKYFPFFINIAPSRTRPYFCQFHFCNIFHFLPFVNLQVINLSVHIQRLGQIDLCNLKTSSKADWLNISLLFCCPPTMCFNKCTPVRVHPPGQIR